MCISKIEYVLCVLYSKVNARIISVIRKVGTKRNPVVLTPEISTSNKSLYESRVKLIEYTSVKYLSNEQTLRSLNLYSEGGKFLMNVITNPHFNFAETRIVLFLYDYLKGYTGGFFTVSERRKTIGNFPTLGSKDSFYSCFYHRQTTTEEHSKDDIISLPDVLFEHLNIVLSPPRLTGIIRKLHSFSYITVTDVNFHNTIFGLATLREYVKSELESVEYCRSLTSGRSNLKHIRISEYMDKVDISNKWIWDKSGIQESGSGSNEECP